MAQTIIIFLFHILLISSYTQVETTEHGFISMEVSDKGLDFVKELLVNNAISSSIPLKLPQIEKSVKIPVVGTVHMILSNIIIYQINISSSIIQPGESGLTIVASGATANLTMEWKYSYSTWLFPTISDKGDAFVQVEGMEIGVTLNLKNSKGTLNISMLDCGCYVQDIFIQLDGGASWLYQGVVDAFEGKIRSTVEDNISGKLRDGIIKTDLLLQHAPKEVLVDKYAAINVSLVNDPVFSNSSFELQINGLFTAKNKLISYVNDDNRFSLSSASSCEDLDKMVKISLHENVLNSASLAYFNENLMNWVVDDIPAKSLLNTFGWRYIVPNLYKQYPDDDMKINVSFSSPPLIEIKQDNIIATFYMDLTVDVLDGNDIVPVVCISTVITVSGYAEIMMYSLHGNVKLRDFDLSLKWSKIGNLHMRVLQAVMSTFLKGVVLPYMNLRLNIGFPLPILHGYGLDNAQLAYADSQITICSDVGSTYQVDQTMWDPYIN